MNLTDIDILTNRNLYLSDDKNLEESLRFAASLESTPHKPMCHMYWRVPREFGRKQYASVCSAAKNGGFSQVILWSNVSLKENEWVKKLPKNVILEIWNPIEQISDTFLAPKRDFFLKNHIDDSRCWLGGDLFRLLCLYKYGGFYLDCDTITIRSFSPLFWADFLYQWGSSGTTEAEPNLLMNGAIMSFRRRSENVKRMLYGLVETTPTPNTFSWGRDLYGRYRTPETRVLPCAWFNTEWGLAWDMQPFKKNKYSNHLFEGCFTWHWHNQWDAEIEEGSKFQILESMCT